MCHAPFKAAGLHPRPPEHVGPIGVSENFESQRVSFLGKVSIHMDVFLKLWALSSTPKE